MLIIINSKNKEKIKKWLLILNRRSGKTRLVKRIAKYLLEDKVDWN